MKIFDRTLKKQIIKLLKHGKSILLLGPRQVGKTTLAKSLPFDLQINLAITKDRQFFEKNPDFLAKQIQGFKKKPLVFIDEIQKVPVLLNDIQDLIDGRKAQFLLTGSSARKLKNEIEVNLIPGRILNLRLDSLNCMEAPVNVEDIFQFGRLPQILIEHERALRELDMVSYVENYIEDEIRKETKIRNIANYSRFLELAAIQSGKVTNFSEISKELGPTVMTIQSYYQILEDTLFADRIDPYLKNSQRKKLTKASKYLFFDLGVRRICAREGTQFLPDRKGELFEHYVGNEILKWIRSQTLTARLYYWRDSDGPEIDWLIEYEGALYPIEVKYRENISEKDAKHLYTFINEYSQAKIGLVIYKGSSNFALNEKIKVLSHFDLFRGLNAVIIEGDRSLKNL